MLKQLVNLVVASGISDFKVVLGIPRTVWTSDISDVTTDFDWARDWESLGIMLIDDEE